jgi:hypothetical protein
MTAIATIKSEAICAWRRPRNTPGSVRRKLRKNLPPP